MLGLNGSGPFMSNSQQSGLPSGPNPPGHPPMNMLGGNPQNPNNRYMQQPGHMLGGAQQPRSMPLRPGPNQPPMNPTGGPGGPQMGNIGMGGINFQPGMMQGGQQSQIRRVGSQSSMNQTMGMGMGQGMGTNSMVMGGMNPQNMPPNAMRQVSQPLPGQQPQMPMRGPIQPEGQMPMNRPTPGMSTQNIGRPNTMPPLMGSLNSPQPTLTQTGMAGGMSRNDFHPPQLSSSPRPVPAPNMPIGAPGSSQNPMNRRTPDNNNNMFMANFGGNPNFSQSPQNNRMTNGYPFVSSTPPNSMEMSQSLPASLTNTPSNVPGNLTTFTTPAQKLEQMHTGDNFSPFGMSQGQNGVPSHASQPHNNPSHPPHPLHRPPSSQQHHSPPHHDVSMNMYPTRPQSQPQNNSVGRPSSSHTPRPNPLQPPSQQPTPIQQHQQHQHHHPSPVPPNSAGLHQPGRVAPQNTGGGQPPLQSVLRPGSSGGIGPPASVGSSSAPQVGPSSQQHPLPIAPRPPQPQNPPQQTPPQPPLRPQSHPPGAPVAESSPRDDSPPSSATAGPSQPPVGPGPGPGVGMSGPPPTGFSGMMRPGPFNPNPSAGPSLPHAHAVGHGQGLMRLLQFSGGLANESKTKLQLSWWNDLVREYFTPKSIMKYTLWKDNQRTEAKVFVTTQSGVKSMTLTLDGARERLYDYGHAIVECVSAVWTYKYNNGYTVILKGPMTVHVVLTTGLPPGASGHHPHHQLGGNYFLKFENFEFEAKSHEKFIAIDAIAGRRQEESPRLSRGGSGRHSVNGLPISGSMDSVGDQDEERRWEEPRMVIERGHIPGEPVNAFGIPQATMRCLELSDSCADMSDLISFTSENDLGPLDALKAYGSKLRESMPHYQPSQNMMNGFINPGQGTPTTAHFPLGPAGSAMAPVAATSPAITLYSPAPASVTHPNSMTQTPSTMASAMSSPQNLPGSTQNSPRKQHKTIPQPPGVGGAGVVSGIAPTMGSSNSGSSSTPGASSVNTPSLAAATLKRKQNPDTESQPPSKRTQRKRKGL
ncbi:hypothetical protein V5O48_000787 [Marasmius crinis-equi]|uniref:Uncharacterized protein n=1 Tax=Marasmius crinis-equi TaxID=585013 RepID=A0ABR3G187_9AGAR